MRMNSYNVIKFPKSRIGTFDLGVIGNKKHHVTALLEIDITNARKAVRRKKQHSRISFTAWILKTISDTLLQHKEICGYLGSKNRKFIFDDISITLTVEKDMQGVKVPLPLLIEHTEAKTAEEITAIIDNAKRSSTRNDEDTVMNNKYSDLQMKIYYLLPNFLRIFLLERIIANPFQSKNAMGNVVYTTVGMTGKSSAWIIPKSYHNLCFAMGGITKKPWVVNETIEIREIMNMTILFNHDVVDGVPMAKFVSDLVKKIENPKA